MEINLSHSEQKGSKSNAEWNFWAFTGQLNSISAIHVAFFTISHRNKILSFFSFLYFRSSLQSRDTKRADYCYYYYYYYYHYYYYFHGYYYYYYYHHHHYYYYINTLFEIGKIYIALQKSCSIIRHYSMLVSSRSNMK